MRFAAHQTFHIREGWLFKGMDAIRDEEAFFMMPEASERLGLGKNMVRALRFWMTATGLTREYMKVTRERPSETEDAVEKRQTVQELSDPFGSLVWEHDRFQEHLGTLWLLHYHLMKDQDNATAWYWFFNHFAQPRLDSGGFVSSLQSWMIGTAGNSISEKSLKRDFDCLVRTYVPDRETRSPEGVIECPLAQLGLLAEANSSQQGSYRLLRPEAARIHPLVLLYVLLHWREKHHPDTQQVGLAQVLREPTNAGRVFNLRTAGLGQCLTRLSDDYPGLTVRLTRTAGLDQLTLPPATADHVLERYYGTLQ